MPDPDMDMRDRFEPKIAQLTSSSPASRSDLSTGDQNNETERDRAKLKYAMTLLLVGPGIV